MACFRLVPIGFLIALVFAAPCSAANFQSVYVTNGTDEFYNLTLVGCTSDAICDDVFNQSFTSASNRTGAYVIVELGENTTYNDDYYFSAYIDGRLLYNRTRTFAGRGNITAAMVWTASPSNGDTLHLTTADGVFDYLALQGYLTAESDPQVNTINFGDVCRGIAGDKIDCDLTRDSSGDCTGDVCGGGHTHSEYLTAETDPQVGTLTDNKVCKASGGAVECIYDGTTADDVFLNISALQDNVSDLWTNASEQSAVLVALWTNASVQSAQLVLLWENSSDQQTHIGNLWINASDQQTKINFLMLNASNQDTRILALEGRPLQPSVDAANVTSGTFVWARMPANTLNTTSCPTGQFYLYGTGCVVAPAAQPNINWANITAGTAPKLNIDAANVTSGVLVNARWVNSTYLNSIYLNRSGSLQDGRGCQYTSATGVIDCTETYQESAQPNIDAANITSGTILNARYNGTYLLDKPTAASTYLNYSSCGAGNYWVYSSGCTATTTGGAAQPNIDAANVTSGVLVNARWWNQTLLNGIYLNKSGTLANTKVCTYNSAIGTIDCNSDPSSYNDAWIVGNFSAVNVNVTALQGNVTDLWTNATGQQGSLNSLWSNASNQDGRIIALEAGGSPAAANGNISQIWGNISGLNVNVTALQGNVTALWTNASVQETHIRNLGLNVSALQGNVSGLVGNVTGLQAQNTSLWLNASGQDISIGGLWWNATIVAQHIGNLYGNVSGLVLNVTALRGNVSSLVDNVTSLRGNVSSAVTNITSLQTSAANAYQNITSLRGNVTAAINNITGLRGNVTEAINNITSVRGNITGLNVNVTALQGNMATVTINITALQSNVTSLWTNATAQDARLWNVNSTCKWIRFT